MVPVHPVRDAVLENHSHALAGKGKPKGKAGRVTAKNDKYNREGWLVAASELMIPWLKAAGAGKSPKWRVSVGWPLGVRPKRNGQAPKAETIGQCFCHSCSKDGTYEMFISPVLEDTGEVLATLLHELVHAFVGIEAKHGKDFKLIAEKVGLTGKMTATVAGDELKPKLADLAKKLGPYPHAGLTSKGKTLKPKQSTRMLKLECPGCEYVIRTTQKWIDVGVPTCTCGTKFIAPGGDDGDGDED